MKRPQEKRQGAHLRSGTRVVLAALVPAKGDENQALLAAVAAAIVSSGARIVATLVQRRGASRSPRPGGSRIMSAPMHAATFLGRGKAIELATLVESTKAERLVLCNPLSGTQKRNLEKITGVRVLLHTEVLQEGEATIPPNNAHVASTDSG